MRPHSTDLQPPLCPGGAPARRQGLRAWRFDHALKGLALRNAYVPAQIAPRVLFQHNQPAYQHLTRRDPSRYDQISHICPPGAPRRAPGRCEVTRDPETRLPGVPTLGEALGGWSVVLAPL